MVNSSKVSKVWAFEESLLAKRVDEQVNEVLAAVKWDKKVSLKKKAAGGGKVGSGGATGN